MDRQTVMWVVMANLLAGGMMYQRLDKMGYLTPVKQQVSAVVEPVLEALGLFHASYQQCGLQDSTMFVLTSSRVVHPDGVRPGAITVRGGKIVSVTDRLPARSRYPVIDYGAAVISPGVIDVHVHMNEPGREDWEGMSTATSAAAAGGITTVVDMPLNSFPTTTNAEELLKKMAIAEVKAKVNVGFWGGITPANAHKHDVLWGMLKAGALGFKSFVSPSGINDFENVSRSDIADAMHFLLSKGAPYFVHAELVTDVEQAEEDPDPRKYSTYLATRPPKFEQDAAHMLIDTLLDEHIPPTPGFFLHIAHLGDASNIEGFKVIKKKLPLSVETCAHYLTFAAETIPDGDTRFKCAPPLRDAANRAALLAAIKSGDIDIISSDHSPAPPGMKETESGDFLKAWGGISGLQYLLPATWTAVQAVGVDLLQLSHVLSSNPALLTGLSFKGHLAPRMDADIAVWDPEAVADTSVQANQHRHKLTPYSDLSLKGRVLATYVGGHKVFGEREGVFRGTCGSVIRRKWVNIFKERRKKDEL